MQKLIKEKAMEAKQKTMDEIAKEKKKLENTADEEKKELHEKLKAAEEAGKKLENAADEKKELQERLKAAEEAGKKMKDQLAKDKENQARLEKLEEMDKVREEQFKQKERLMKLEQEKLENERKELEDAKANTEKLAIVEKKEQEDTKAQAENLAIVEQKEQEDTKAQAESLANMEKKKLEVAESEQRLAEIERKAQELSKAEMDFNARAEKLALMEKDMEQWEQELETKEKGDEGKQATEIERSSQEALEKAEELLKKKLKVAEDAEIRLKKIQDAQAAKERESEAKIKELEAALAAQAFSIEKEKGEPVVKHSEGDSPTFKLVKGSGSPQSTLGSSTQETYPKEEDLSSTYEYDNTTPYEYAAEEETNTYEVQPSCPCASCLSFPEGSSPIFLATYYGHTTCLQALLLDEPDLNIIKTGDGSGRTALHIGAAKGQVCYSVYYISLAGEGGVTVCYFIRE
jgi:hypothetical protein